MAVSDRLLYLFEHLVEWSWPDWNHCWTVTVPVCLKKHLQYSVSEGSTAITFSYQCQLCRSVLMSLCSWIITSNSHMQCPPFWDSVRILFSLVSALKVFLTHGLRQHHDADDDDDDAAVAHDLKRLLEHLAMKIKILTECQKDGHFAQCLLISNSARLCLAVLL